MLIPDILIYKSPLAVHRLPMRGFTARNGASMGLVDRRPVVCRNLGMGFWVPLHYGRRKSSECAESIRNPILHQLLDINLHISHFCGEMIVFYCRLSPSPRSRPRNRLAVLVI